MADAQENLSAAQIRLDKVKAEITTAQADRGLESSASVNVHVEGVPALLLEVVDLADFAGEKVSLALSTSAERPGTIAFWGAPAVRQRVAWDAGGPPASHQVELWQWENK